MTAHLTRESIHARCGAVGADDDGWRTICHKSDGHEYSRVPERRRHCDPGREYYWTDPEPSERIRLD